MTGQVFCGECGTAMPSTGRFCPSCGAAQQSYTASEQPAAPDGGAEPFRQGPQQGPPPPAGGHHQAPPGAWGAQQHAPHHDAAAAARRAAQGAARRVETVQPGAGELAAQLGQQLSTPGVVVAGLSGLVALAACLVVGLVFAIMTPDDSIIGSFSADTDVLGETLRLAVGTTMARFGEGGFTTTVMPVLMLLVPLGASAVAAYLLTARTAGLSVWARLLWPMGTGPVIAVPMLILALVADADEASFSAGSVLLYSLLWGALGGFAGTFVALRRSSPQMLQGLVPPALSWGLRSVTVPLRTLGLLLAVTGAIGLAMWEVQSLRDEPFATGGRDIPNAFVENVLFVGEFAVVFAGLGTFSEVTSGALPVDTSEVDFSASEPDELSDAEDFAPTSEAEAVRLFAYSDALAPFVFIPMLIALIALPIIAALYAGFATARSMATPSQAASAGWGAVVGIVWALALVVIRAIGNVDVLVGDSLFGGVLLVGTAAGAIGGLLAGQALAPGAPPPGSAVAAGGPYPGQYPYAGQAPPPGSAQPPYQGRPHG
jgi:hypothetical protein